jgi:apolipoprotein N-acyltransferase
MTATTAGVPRRRRAQDTVLPTPLPAAIVLGLFGGACFLLAFPPYGMWALLPVGLAALNASVLTRSWGTAALASGLWGLAFFVPLTIWARTYAGAMPWLALGIFEALFVVLYGLAARAVFVRRGVGIGSGLVVCALWVAVETLRSHAPWGGLPWGATAFALSDSPLLNLGPWVGTAGLAFVVALLGQFLFGGMLAIAGRRQQGMTGLSGVWPLAGVIGVVIVSLVVPAPHNPPPAGRDSLRVAGIQGNVPPIDPVTLAMPPETFDNHVTASQDAEQKARDEGTGLDLMVWPEDTTVDPRTNTYNAQVLSQISKNADAPVLVGTQSLTDDGKGRYNNSLLWTADGDGGFVYAKRHPVPFGEYVPMRSFFRGITDKVDMVGTDMLPGNDVGVMDLDGHGVGVLICFEIAYDTLVNDVVDDDAQMIVVQSNNALFGTSHEAIQQVAEAKVMAVVSGRSVVHVSTVGQSAIFTPEGRTVAYQDHWTQGSVMGDVPLRTGITPAMAAGYWTAVVISAIGVAGLLAALARRGPRAVSRPKDLARPRRR